MLYRLTISLRKSCQTYNIHQYAVISAKMSRPKFLFSCWCHFSLTLRTGMQVPDTDIVTATVETQPSNFASVGWCHICDDAADHNILNGLAVGTAHGRNLLTEESAPFIHISLVSTVLTTVFQFPSHLFLLCATDSLGYHCSACGITSI